MKLCKVEHSFCMKIYSFVLKKVAKPHENSKALSVLELRVILMSGRRCVNVLMIHTCGSKQKPYP
jgi:hypothetical protein